MNDSGCITCHYHPAGHEPNENKGCQLLYCLTDDDTDRSGFPVTRCNMYQREPGSDDDREEGL